MSKIFFLSAIFFICTVFFFNLRVRLGKSFFGVRALRMKPSLSMALRLQREAAGVVLEKKILRFHRATNSRVVKMLVY